MVIELKDIIKCHHTRQLLNNINVKIDNKQVIALLGPSGSGKTSLLRLMIGLDKPTSGYIYYDGLALTNNTYKTIIAKLGIVFQHFCLFNNMNVIHNATYAAKIAGNHNANAEAIKLLIDLGLKDQLYDFPSSLSGGQKQRLAICRALMLAPEVMMFDEPTSALDLERTRELISLIKKLKSKMTVIIVTHHLEFAKLVADRILFMDQGTILDDQSTEEFIKYPTSERARIFLQATKLSS